MKCMVMPKRTDLFFVVYLSVRSRIVKKHNLDLVRGLTKTLQIRAKSTRRWFNGFFSTYLVLDTIDCVLGLQEIVFRIMFILTMVEIMMAAALYPVGRSFFNQQLLYLQLRLNTWPLPRVFKRRYGLKACSVVLVMMSLLWIQYSVIIRVLYFLQKINVPRAHQAD
ncbi:hypothetical protein OSB04_012318 [Centaurea solstitialis]|uniref:Uncharacterized protein n=1 Tax=Centaurea solstitialis TaxID=347529 RepID=A0AA38WPW6_9ASTR|nr:hypothetical protein OSB04_012318 [Centaurea solstitialis]